LILVSLFVLHNMQGWFNLSVYSDLSVL